MRYRDLNSALNSYFFDGRFFQQPVYLDVEGGAAREIGEKIGVDPEELGEFIGQTVARKLHLDTPDPYAFYKTTLLVWNAAGRIKAPPFTELLCAFSVAAERMRADENFSANNYYERLFELFEVSEDGHKNKLKQHARDTEQFWRALNVWLAEKTYEVGRPTARSLRDNWRYVSYAVSQALVREADRQRLSDLFERMDLMPGEQVSEAEMRLYIHEWMSGGTGPNSWLRRLWETPRLRDRLVTAALDELEHWSPKQQHRRDGRSKVRLGWEATFVSFPGKRAIFTLGARGAGLEEQLSVKPVEGAEPDGAIAEFPADLSLSTGSDGEALYLGPPQEVDLSRLLLKSHVFVGRDSNTEYVYTAKPFVIMAKSNEGATYREVARAGLFEELALLCHSNWLPRVRTHLDQCARPGYVVHDCRGYPGIPENWVVLRGVEIVKPAGQADSNLESLVPVGGEASIGATGGIRLGPGIWHSGAPPILEATGEGEGLHLQVIREELGGEDPKLLSVDANEGFMEVDLSKSEVALDGANVRGVVSRGNTEVNAVYLSFRSADTPRPPRKDGLVYPVGETGLTWSPEARDLSTEENLAGVQGASVFGEVKIFSDEDRPLSSGAAALPDGESEMPFNVRWKTGTGAEGHVTDSCVVRGYHHWIVDPTDTGDQYAPSWGLCQDCGLRKLMRSRAAALQAAHAYRAGAIMHFRPARDTGNAANFAEGQEEKNHRVDTLFDAVCYLGRGSWSQFRRLCGDVSDRPLFPLSLIWELSALGHLDVATDASGRPLEWEVAPPTLVFTGPGKGYLAGYHGSAFLDLLSEVLANHGATYSPVPCGEWGLTVHRWVGLPDQGVEDALTRVEDPLVRNPRISRRVGEVIAGRAPALRSLIGAMPAAHLEAMDGLQRFDPARARWEPAQRANQAGAYKAGLYGNRYFYRDVAGVCRETHYSVAKTLAALDEDKRLHAYDPSTGEFACALGTEPFGLLARALVTSSGKLPRREGGRVVYAGVPDAVGSRVMKKLYGQEQF